MKLNRILFFLALVGICGFSWPFSWMIPHPNAEKIGTNAWVDKEVDILEAQTDNLDPKVLRLSLTAFLNAKKRGLDTRQVLTVIDYSKPSYDKRLWVFDLKDNRVLFYTWVTHGKNSGDVNATSFSNRTGSLKSSIGVFLTDDSTYIGSKGYALRLRGLEKGVNDNAYNRDVVFHGAWYANADTIHKYGQAGRSWGCPAVPTSTIKPLADAIKRDTIVVAYYPDRNWLRNSKFLASS